MAASWENVNQWDAYIQQASAQYGIPAEVIKSIIMIESQGIPNAISPQGYKGLMQLGPASSNAGSIDWSRIYDPAYNILKGTEQLTIKQNAARSFFGREPTWDEVAGFYFGWVPGTGKTDSRGTTTEQYMARFNTNMGELGGGSPQTAGGGTGAGVGSGIVNATIGLNVRSSPSVGGQVLTAMPYGANVAITGQPQNGWYPVSYGGVQGWVSGEWLGNVQLPPIDTGAGGGSGGGSGPILSPTTAANLRLRAAANTSSDTLAIMPNNSQIEVTGPAVNGWFPVTYNGQSGWASGDYINIPDGWQAPGSNPDSGGDAGGSFQQNPTYSTTSNLNLRSGAGTDNDILTTIPEGSSLNVTGDPQGDWFPVQWNDTTGWSHKNWLQPTQGNPFYDPSSTYGSDQNWYDTPLVKQNQDFPSEWEKLRTESGFAGLNRKGDWALDLQGRARQGYNAATQNNPGLQSRDYVQQTLGSDFLENAYAGLTDLQKGNRWDIFAPRARVIER